MPFVKPLSAVREAVEELRPVLRRGARPRRLQARGGARARRSRSSSPPSAARCSRSPPRQGDGAFTNWLPLSGVKQVAEAFGAPDKELVCRFFCIPQPAEEAMGLAKWMFAAYGTVGVYAEFFRWLGWGEQIDPMVEAWQGGDRTRALELVPEDLVREIFLFGDPGGDAASARRRSSPRGITTLVLTPIAHAGPAAGAHRRPRAGERFPWRVASEPPGKELERWDRASSEWTSAGTKVSSAVLDADGLSEPRLRPTRPGSPGRAARRSSPR